MLVKSSAKFLRLSPRKVRQVLDVIRDQDVNSALSTLSLTNKRPNYYIRKIIKSAISSAKVKGIREEQLYISKAVAEEGSIWKRFKAAAFGRAAPIKKRTCHIKIELDIK